jgi:hypothetical protein
MKPHIDIIPGAITRIYDEALTGVEEWHGEIHSSYLVKDFLKNK